MLPELACVEVTLVAVAGLRGGCVIESAGLRQRNGVVVAELGGASRVTIDRQAAIGLRDVDLVAGAVLIADDVAAGADLTEGHCAATLPDWVESSVLRVPVWVMVVWMFVPETCVARAALPSLFASSFCVIEMLPFVTPEL